MRITYIHQHFATLASASGTRSFFFASRLAASGHRVTVITSDTFLSAKLKCLDRFEVAGFSVINVKSGYAFELSLYKRMLSFLRFMIASTYWGLKTPTDLVFATSTPLTVALPALVIKFIRRIPFVFEVRDLWPDVPAELGVIRNRTLIFAAKCLEYLAYAFSDRIVCISEGIRRRIAAPDRKKVYIPTGCNLELFPQAKDTRWKENAGIDADFLFILTGAIGEANAPEYLVEAARILRDRRADDIAIALVGDGSAKEKVAGLIAEYDLSNLLIFRPVERREIPSILAASDGGIILHGVSQTYRETATPNKFFDYVAAGLPVIFNFEGPLKQMILDSKAGYYVDHRFPAQLSEALIYLASHPDECRAAGKRARHLAEAEFDQKRTAKRFEEVLTRYS